jgi:hypothetical protein
VTEPGLNEDLYNDLRGVRLEESESTGFHRRMAECLEDQQKDPSVKNRRGKRNS